MDNKDFDKKIQEKLSQLTPAYDPQAWDALNYRLDLMAPVPWYAKWKSALLVGALGLFTLINLAILWRVKEDKQSISELINTTQIEKEAKAIIIYDTVQVYERISTNASTSLGQSLSRSNSFALSSGGTYYPNNYSSIVPRIVTVTAPVAPNSNQQAVAYYQALLNELQAEKDRDLRLKYNLDLLDGLNPLAYKPEPLTLNFEQRYLHPVPTLLRKPRKPLNIRAGLSTGLLIPDPDLGERFLSSRVSIMFETPLKTDLYLHTGLNFQHLIYNLDDVDDEQFDQIELGRYPGYNSFANIPDKIKTDNTVLQIPLHLRYYGALNNRWSVYLGGGPTVDLLLQQKFTYSFITINQNRLEEFDETTVSNQSRINLGAIAGEFGLSHNFTPQFSGQIGLNYQYGIGKLGLEKRSFNSLTFNTGLFYQIGKR